MASMIAPIASYWISVERRMLVQVIPESMRKIWDRWDIRGPVVTSFAAQAFLTTMGGMRKTNHDVVHLDIFLWIFYLLSEWVVNFALDMIFSELGNYSVDPTRKPELDPDLMAFWATFMLVHLGGPPTITAYALEDNALWPRTLVIWLVQSGRVLYMILLAWRSTWLSYISIAMLVDGCIKCGERTCALYSASIDNRRDQSIPPLHNSSSDQEMESRHVMIDTSVHGDDDHDERQHSAITNPRELIQNFMSFFISLFGDLVISNEDLRKGQSDFRQLKAEDAFNMVENELGYVYDIFYTKAFVRSSYWGQLSQLITFSITLIVLVCFQIKVIPSYRLLDWDKKITYALLGGALAIETIEFLIWIAARLKENFGGKFYFLSGRVDELLTGEQEFKNNFLCTDLLTLCLQGSYLTPTSSLVRQMQNIDARLSEATHNWEVTHNLKSYIFDHMKEFSSIKYGFNEEIDVKGHVSIKWTKNLDFHQSILTWHIATDICFHCDNDNSQENNVKEICKNLSDYMLYLLVSKRFMLPTGTGLVGYRDTFVETKEFLRREKKSISLPGLFMTRLRPFMTRLTGDHRRPKPFMTQLTQDLCTKIYSVFGGPKKPREDHNYESLLREICY